MEWNLFLTWCKSDILVVQNNSHTSNVSLRDVFAYLTKDSQNGSMCYQAFYEIMHISAIAASVCKSKCIASRCIHAEVASTNLQLHPRLISVIPLNISVTMLTAAFFFVFYRNLPL